MKRILSPSILSADFRHLEEDIKEAEKGGAQYLHIDVMDGMFVPSISFGMPVMKSIRSATDLVFDVHLMIEEPGRYIEDFVNSGADLITVHAEACKHLDRTIQQIKDHGCKVGVALNPATPLCVLDHIIGKLDMILVMTVNPGFGGQKYIPEMTEKIRTLRNRLNALELQTDIQVDGGMSEATVHIPLEAGANVIVAGSAIFGKGDVCLKTQRMLEIMENSI